MWSELSNELSAAVGRTAPRLVHVGGRGIAGRTGVVWGPGLVVTLARDADDGETVPVVGPSGPLAATVKAWNPRSGWTVLAVERLEGASWEGAPVPAVGALVLTVARPSEHGPEARLDLVRYAGQGVVQTDGAAYPGFTGAAVVDDRGRLVGLVSQNQGGNDGAVVPFEELKAEVDRLVAEGTPKAAWLGVSTRPAGGQGLALAAIEPGSPADQAGWKAGDLLVSLEGQTLGSPGDLVRLLAGLKPGVSVAAKVLRGGVVHDLPVTPAGR